MAAETYVHLDDRQLTTLAHPLRHRILSALRSDGPATSTTVADRLGSNSGKTSYHLRVLADVGLVAEDAERGNARDRWWRAAHDVTVFEPHRHAESPESSAASRFLMGRAATYYAAQIEQWLTGQDDWSRDWVEAASMSDRSIALSPDDMREMNRAIEDVIASYVDRAADRASAGDHSAADNTSNNDSDADTDTGSEPVDCTVIYTAFPNPRPVL